MDEFKENKLKIAQHQAALEEKIAALRKDYQANNPEVGELFGVKTDVKVYVKRPKGFSQVVFALAERVQWSSRINSSQKALLEEVALQFPEQNILPNIWQKPLTKWEYKRVCEIVRGNEFYSLNMKGCQTLSELRKRVKLAYQKKAVEHTYSAKIHITKDAVIIGNACYPIESRKVGEYEYPSIRLTVEDKRPYLRVDHLKAFLTND